MRDIIGTNDSDGSVLLPTGRSGRGCNGERGPSRPHGLTEPARAAGQWTADGWLTVLPCHVRLPLADSGGRAVDGERRVGSIRVVSIIKRVSQGRAWHGQTGRFSSTGYFLNFDLEEHSVIVLPSFGAISCNSETNTLVLPHCFMIKINQVYPFS